MWMYGMIVIMVLLVVYVFILYNNFIKLSNKVKEAFSTMDVYLKKRWDLIPSIVETVKGYAEYERDTLKEIIDLRNRVYDKMSMNQKIKTNETLASDIYKTFTTDYISQARLDSDMMYAEKACYGAAQTIVNTFTPEDIEISETLYCLWIAE